MGEEEGEIKAFTLHITTQCCHKLRILIGKLEQSVILNAQPPLCNDAGLGKLD